MEAPSNDLKEIEEWYQKIQSQFAVYEVDKVLGNNLLRPQAVEQQPVHNWYILKESCSLQLPLWTVERIKAKFNASIEQVFDPFIGCGTTACALAPLGMTVDGLEHNPFIRFVATTKADVSLVDKEQATAFVDTFSNKMPNSHKFEWPELSTIHNTAYFRKDDIRFILYALQEIEQKVKCKHTQDFLKLGIAKLLEPISNLRKDGRALRYVKKRHRPTAIQILTSTWRSMLDDITPLRSSMQTFRVFSGNARELSCVKFNGRSLIVESESYDLVLYSPPYLNNFDYSEIYKVEMWLLGFVSNYQEWRDLRSKTIRSHHSLRFEETKYLLSDKRTQRTSKWIDAIAGSKELAGYAAVNMPSVIRGYFDDMYLALKEQYRILKPGGFIAYIVANSRHSNLPIATDVILGEIARNIGFRPVELIILKNRNGRTKQKNFLRESLVLMQKPKKNLA